MPPYRQTADSLLTWRYAHAQNQPSRCVGRPAALCLAATMAACSNDSEKSSSSGPVEIEYWAWADAQPVVDKFNATHTDIKVKFVKQADLQTTATGLRNAVAAGSGIPVWPRTSVTCRPYWRRACSLM